MNNKKKELAIINNHRSLNRVYNASSNQFSIIITNKKIKYNIFSYIVRIITILMFALIGTVMFQYFMYGIAKLMIYFYYL